MLADKSRYLVLQFQVHSMMPTERGFPSVAYWELPLQLRPVACTLFRGTELVLARHVDVGLGTLV